MNQKHDKLEAVKNGLDLFCSKGYTNVGLDEICQVTGMTKGSFYNAFKSKEQFLLETIDLFNTSNTARINTELEPKRTVKAIQLLKRFYVNMLAVQPEVNFMGCMVNNMMSELGANNETVAIVTAEGFDNIINAIEPTVRQAQQEGDIDQTYTSKEVASLLHTTFYGVLTRAKSLGSIKPGKKTMEQLFNHLKPKNT